MEYRYICIGFSLIPVYISLWLFLDEVCRNIQGWYDFFHASQSQQLSMLQLLFFEIKEAEQAAASYNLSELQYSATKTILMTNTES